MPGYPWLNGMEFLRAKATEGCEGTLGENHPGAWCVEWYKGRAFSL